MLTARRGRCYVRPLAGVTRPKELESAWPNWVPNTNAYSCGAKFYDFGRPAPICPKCGANQKDAKRPDFASESAQTKRKRRDDVPKAVPAVEDDLVLGSGRATSPTTRSKSPEGVVEEEDDFDDDDE